MRADLPALVPLVCPSCRRRSEGGRDMFTVELAERYVADGDRLIDGLLRCVNPACARGYPVAGGIPIVAREAGGLLERDAAGAGERDDLAPEIAALLAGPGPDDAPVARLLEHLSIYLDAHWGDRAAPRPDVAAPGPMGIAPLLEELAAHGRGPVSRAVDLGCGVGRATAALAANAELVVGIDIQVAALRRARKLLGGDDLRYARRSVGRHYQMARIAAPAPVPNASFVAGDVLDPPLVPGGFGRVVALNVLDAVVHPARLLSVVDGLCAPGGEIHLASPFTWQSGVVAEDARPGGADPAAWLRRTLETGEGLEARYRILAEVDVPWVLRREARGAVAYLTRYVAARKLGGAPG